MVGLVVVGLAVGFDVVGLSVVGALVGLVVVGLAVGFDVVGLSVVGALVGLVVVGLAVGFDVVGLSVVGALVGLAVVGALVGAGVGGTLHLLVSSSQEQPSEVATEPAQPSGSVHLVQEYLQVCGLAAVVAHDCELAVHLHLDKVSFVQSACTSYAAHVSTLYSYASSTLIVGALVGAGVGGTLHVLVLSSQEQPSEVASEAPHSSPVVHLVHLKTQMSGFGNLVWHSELSLGLTHHVLSLHAESSRQYML